MPAEGLPAGHDPNRIYVGPPIYTDMRDQMLSQSETQTSSAPQEEADWPKGRFGLN